MSLGTHEEFVLDIYCIQTVSPLESSLCFNIHCLNGQHIIPVPNLESH